MKNTTSKIDRATLLTTGGTAALASLLLGATKPSPKHGECCAPIDLSYETTTSKTKRHGAKATTSLGGVRVVSRNPNDPTAPHLNGWNAIGVISAAKVDGYDQNGKGVNQNLGYDLWVYTK